jgi:hypothetical protein
MPDPRGPLTPGSARDLQGMAGNAAVKLLVQRQAGSGPVVQRAIAAEQADAIARRLEDAMSGLGTDEEAIYGALAGRTAADMTTIKAAYRRLFNEDLDAELEDELTASELAHVRRMMAPLADESGLSAGEQQAAAMDRAAVIADQLVEAMRGLGTEEDQIFNALMGRTPDELLEIRQQYQARTGRQLDRDLIDELSGDELQRALNLLGIAAGTFTNQIVQEMTEGITTGGQGRFEWALDARQLRAEAPVRFVPDPGVTPPYARWNQEIDARWNRFAAVEPGGRKVPINLSMRDDPGESRVIQVHRNKVPGVVSPEDRANAGEWFEVMGPTTAPHEFGHYIGLEDEYQRTHGDFRRITGGAPATGPANASGKSPEEIARELHAALYLEDPARRAPAATTLLTSVGLIVSGVPQQGDFAQSVKTAYDAAYSGIFSKNLVEAMRDKLPAGSKWTIQTVFSFASRSIMGNAGALTAPGAAPDPHDHAVEPRHMREFLAIVKRTWPSFDWQIGPRS